MLDGTDETEPFVDQVHSWHRRLQVKQLAHIQQALLFGHCRRAFGTSAAILATFTGASWATDLSTAGAPDIILRWVAAIAGLLGGALVAVNTTMDWAKRADEHEAAAAHYSQVRHAIEEWYVEHPAGAPQADRDRKAWQLERQAWMHHWSEADATSPLVSAHALRRAEMRAPSDARNACRSQLTWPAAVPTKPALPPPHPAL